MRELPPGWIEATIGDLAEYVSRGKSPKYTERSELPVVNQRAIRWYGIENEYLKYVHPDQFERWTEQRFIHEGDILWNSTGTGTIGRACLIQPKDLIPPKVVDSHVTIVRIISGAADPRYLFAWIRGPEVQHGIEELATGTTNQIELSRSTISNTKFPLAPVNEQKRIADKLDAVLARVDACRERLDRVPAILKRFRQAVLAAATSGKLTEEWRRGAVEDKWRELPLSQVARVIDPNPSHRYPSYENGTVPIIATEQFEGRDGYDLSKAKLVNPSFHEERLASHGFHSHDIVFARKGRLGLARNLPHRGKFVFSHTIFIIRSFDPADAPYLLWYLRQDECVEWLLHEMNSNQGVPTLGKSFM